MSNIQIQREKELGRERERERSTNGGSAAQRTASSNYSSSVYDCFCNTQQLFWTHIETKPNQLSFLFFIYLFFSFSAWIFFLFIINDRERERETMVRPRGCAISPEMKRRRENQNWFLSEFLIEREEREQSKREREKHF